MDTQDKMTVKTLKKELLELIEDLEYDNPDLQSIVDQISKVLDEFCDTINEINNE